LEFWFLLAVATAFLWGISGVFAKLGTGRLGVYRVALVIAMVEAPMYVVAFLLLREPMHISLADGALALGSCVIGICGYLSYFESIIDGQVSIVGTISAAYPVLTVIGAIILFGESLTVVQAVGIVAIIGGVVAVSYEPNPGSANSLPKRSLIFAVMAFLLWGAWSLSSKAAIDRIGAGNLFGFYVISSLTAPLLYAWVRRMRPGGLAGTDPSRTPWFLGGIALLLNVVGAFAYSYALEDGNASLVGPTSSAYPLVTVVIALAFLKERISKVQAMALAGVVAGLVLLGVTV